MFDVTDRIMIHRLEVSSVVSNKADRAALNIANVLGC